MTSILTISVMAPVVAMTQAHVNRLASHLDRWQQLSSRLEQLSMQAAHVE